MSSASEVNELHNKSGCTYQECIMAMEYCKKHTDYTPMDYLKAKGLAVNTPSFTFDERVKAFSAEPKGV